MNKQFVRVEPGGVEGRDNAKMFDSALHSMTLKSLSQQCSHALAQMLRSACQHETKHTPNPSALLI